MTERIGIWVVCALCSGLKPRNNLVYAPSRMNLLTHIFRGKRAGWYSRELFYDKAQWQSRLIGTQKQGTMPVISDNHKTIFDNIRFAIKKRGRIKAFSHRVKAFFSLRNERLKCHGYLVLNQNTKPACSYGLQYSSSTNETKRSINPQTPHSMISFLPAVLSTCHPLHQSIIQFQIQTQTRYCSRISHREIHKQCQEKLTSLLRLLKPPPWLRQRMFLA